MTPAELTKIERKLAFYHPSNDPYLAEARDTATALVAEVRRLRLWLATISSRSEEWVSDAVIEALRGEPAPVDDYLAPDIQAALDGMAPPVPYVDPVLAAKQEAAKQTYAAIMKAASDLGGATP